MASDPDPARPATADRDGLQAATVRLEQAWRAAGPRVESISLESLLPPRGDPRRLLLLRELIKVDLEMRCQRRRAIDLEQYLHDFPELGTSASVSPELLRDDYQVRQRHGMAPPLTSYRERFPAQFAEFERLIGDDPFGTRLPVAPTTAPAPAAAPGPKPSIPPPPAAPKPVVAAPVHDGGRALEEAGYRLLSRLGKGAYGEVWRAEAPGRVAAAVKIIQRTLQQKLADRELQALELIKELRHPFLLQTHAYWALEEQVLIAMDLADGTLNERLRQCQEQGLPGIPAPELLRIFREAAEAVDFLHRNNVLHRDIKPANLLLLEGHAKVADFGLAKLQDTAASATTLGTPNYMAPEVWQGKVHAHSDQYALAISYAEMRFGRLPFTSVRDMVSAMSAHLWDTPDLSGLPEAEQQVLLRALKKDPEERYPTCLAFVSALEEACAPPPPAGNDTTRVPEAAAPPASGGRVLRAALLLPLVVMPLAVVLFVWRPWRPEGNTAPPPGEVDWLPPGVEKADGAQVVTVDGKRLYDRVIRVKGDQRVPFLLIPRGKETDPVTFYLMEDKVCNALYRAAVTDSSFQEHLAEFARKRPAAVRNEWEKGGLADGRDVGAEDGQLPVLRVTVTEAHCFAHWLGGQLPTLLQWDKAAGRLDGAKSPFRDPDAPLAPGDVAVGRAREGPLPVGAAPRDVSRFGCRDMAGNGLEWTRDLEAAGSLVPVHEPSEDLLVILRGREYFKPRPLFFADRNSEAFYFDAKPGIGFRVALNPGP
jgi:hypothetical protein